MYLKPLKIGNVELENNILLAPMAGITDLPFRVMCKNYGTGLVCTEMASSKAIFYNDKKTKDILKIEGEKRPIQAQIFGSDVESLKVAAEYVSGFADILDINMGCPAPKVVKNGDGSKLLLDLPKVEEIVTEVVKSSKVPVSVKIRKGWNEESVVAIDAAKIIEKSGASMITVHGRTRAEFFSGDVDLDIIKKVKESVNIPVIGNGNIVDEESALKMFEYTGVDGIMIGRAAIGNPWLFKRIIHFLQTGDKLQEISSKEKLETIIKHIELEVEEKGEKVGIQELRKHMACYIKNLPNASKIRVRINQINRKDELIEYLKECFSN
ncbi:MAG: tRNA dihydrouridine synthase DusB [Clostridia bacterium]|nr:tRNA dihydrouridine synthase DusB [Clostridia bacterium]